MIKAATLSIGILLLNGCGQSSMQLNNGHLSLQVEKNIFQKNGKPIQEKKEGFGSLIVKKQILQLKNKNIIVFVDAKTDQAYEFEHGIARTVGVIFKTQTIYPIFRQSHLHAYQIKLKDGKILNVIAQQDDTQELKILYGMSRKLFLELLKSLGSDKQYTLHSPAFTSTKVNEMLLDTWDVHNVHFYPLVSPLPRLMGY